MNEAAWQRARGEGLTRIAAHWHERAIVVGVVVVEWWVSSAICNELMTTTTLSQGGRSWGLVIVVVEAAGLRVVGHGLILLMLMLMWCGRR